MFDTIKIIGTLQTTSFLNMAKHNTVGRDGEKLALTYLIEQKFEIIDTNWRYNRIEIDIIASINNTIVFIEVKTRSSDKWGNPEDAVNSNKINRIVEAADYYLREKAIDLPARFDIISILLEGCSPEIYHIEDAFFPNLQ